jgi:hypothetical protein
LPGSWFWLKLELAGPMEKECNRLLLKEDLCSALPRIAGDGVSSPASQFLITPRNVFGYEILFRSGVEDYFNSDPEPAARAILDSALL